MKTTTAINKKDNAVNRINTLWKDAAMFHYPHATVLEIKTTIFAELKTCPQWVRSEVEGYNKALYDLHWNNLEFCYSVDSVLYSTHKKSDKPLTEVFYSSGKGQILADSVGKHYYKGTEKSF
jgi:hypothetical protein